MKQMTPAAVTVEWAMKLQDHHGDRSLKRRSGSKVLAKIIDFFRITEYGPVVSETAESSHEPAPRNTRLDLASYP